MSSQTTRSGENALLAALPPEDMARLKPELERVELAFKVVLQEAEQPLSHIWFPRSGVASAVSRMQDGATVELATTGREGFVGIPMLMASQQMAHEVLVQIPGDGDRLPIETFKTMLKELPSLQPLLLRYTLAFVTQVAQGAACNRLHPIEARCARWLLMTHDRVDGDRFPLTHEFLGQTLGVTRPSVSVAAGMLQKAGYIRYSRGIIHILDRDGLEGATCECYGVITNEFRRLVGAF